MKNNLLAQNIGNKALGDRLSGILESEGGGGYLARLIPLLVGIAFVAGLVIFFFQFILGAISWIQSGGDKQAVENARNKILFSVTGFVLLVSVFAIVKLLETVFAVNILELRIFTL